MVKFKVELYDLFFVKQKRFTTKMCLWFEKQSLDNENLKGEVQNLTLERKKLSAENSSLTEELVEFRITV